MADIDQGGVSPATAGGAPAHWSIREHGGRTVSLHEGDEPRALVFEADHAARILAALDPLPLPPAEPDPRDDEIEQLRKECANWRTSWDKVVDRNRGLIEQLTEAREEWQRADAEVTRLKRLVGNENVEPNWKAVNRHEAIRQAECFRQNLAAIRQQRDAVVRQLDKAQEQVTELASERDHLHAELDRAAEQQQAGDIAISVLENIRPQLSTIARSIGLDGSGPDTWREWLDATVVAEPGSST